MSIRKRHLSDGDFKIPVFVLNSNWLFLCQFFFENCSIGLPAEEKPSLELVVRVVNINAGRNKKLLASCRKLYEYSRFVEIVREYTSSEENLTEIIAVAIDEAIREDVLADILKKRRAEVTDWILSVYDEEKHIRNEKRLSFEDGRLETLMDCVSDGLMSVSVAASRCEMSEASFIDEMSAAGKKIPESVTV